MPEPPKPQRSAFSLSTLLEAPTPISSQTQSTASKRAPFAAMAVADKAAPLAEDKPAVTAAPQQPPVFAVFNENAPAAAAPSLVAQTTEPERGATFTAPTFQPMSRTTPTFTSMGSFKPAPALSSWSMPAAAKNDHTITKQLDFNASDLTASTIAHDRDESSVADHTGLSRIGGGRFSSGQVRNGKTRTTLPLLVGGLDANSAIIFTFFQPPSPTINTKAALADVLAMFNAPLPGEPPVIAPAAAAAAPVRASLRPRPTERPAPAAPAAAPQSRGGWSIYCDENAAPEQVAANDQENAPPASFCKPAQTAAAEACANAGAQRSILGPVPGMTLEPLA